MTFIVTVDKKTSLFDGTIHNMKRLNQTTKNQLSVFSNDIV